MTHSGVPALAALTALCFEIFTSYSLRDGSAGASPLFGWELTILDSYWLREFCNIRMLAICSGDSDTRLTQSHTIHILETRESQYLNRLIFRQQLPRKRHIGNDIVTVVFQVSFERENAKSDI